MDRDFFGAVAIEIFSSISCSSGPESWSKNWKLKTDNFSAVATKILTYSYGKKIHEILSLSVCDKVQSN